MLARTNVDGSIYEPAQNPRRIGDEVFASCCRSIELVRSQHQQRGTLTVDRRVCHLNAGIRRVPMKL